VVTLSLAAKTNIVRAGKTLTVLSNATFGVFLVHMVIFEAIRLSFPAVAGGKSVTAMAAAYAATLAGSFLVAFAARRIPLVRSIF
jgi:surface polysaccharide O-acyltransferase-like enzyme